MTQNTGRQTIVVHGAWTGNVTDPQRQFRGQVTASDVTAVQAGQEVGVSYAGSSSRVSGAQEHGKYVLNAGGHDLSLMSFTCGEASKASSAGHDDTQPAEWLAVVV